MPGDGMVNLTNHPVASVFFRREHQVEYRCRFSQCERRRRLLLDVEYQFVFADGIIYVRDSPLRYRTFVAFPTRVDTIQRVSLFDVLKLLAHILLQFYSIPYSVLLNLDGFVFECQRTSE